VCWLFWLRFLSKGGSEFPQMIFCDAPTRWQPPRTVAFGCDCERALTRPSPRFLSSPRRVQTFRFPRGALFLFRSRASRGSRPPPVPWFPWPSTCRRAHPGCFFFVRVFLFLFHPRGHLPLSSSLPPRAPRSLSVPKNISAPAFLHSSRALWPPRPSPARPRVRVARECALWRPALGRA